MMNAVADGPIHLVAGMLGASSPKSAPWPSAQPNEVRSATSDLTSLRIQSLAGRGLLDPKSLRLREIQELSASVVAHIRDQHLDR